MCSVLASPFRRRPVRRPDPTSLQGSNGFNRVRAFTLKGIGVTKVNARTWLIGAALLALLAGGSLAVWMRPPEDASALMSISLPDTSGRQQSLAQWRGKVVVVNF